MLPTSCWTAAKNWPLGFVPDEPADASRPGLRATFGGDSRFFAREVAEFDGPPGMQMSQTGIGRIGRMGRLWRADAYAVKSVWRARRIGRLHQSVGSGA